MASGASPPAPAPFKPSPTAAQGSKSYNVAHIWETAAALDEDQLRVIEELNGACSQRPIPSHVSHGPWESWSQVAHRRSTDPMQYCADRPRMSR